MSVDDTNPFLLVDVQVQPSKNRLVRGEHSVALQPKVMGVLQYLAHNQERVVSTEELIESLWDGRIVSYGAVPKSITSLRKGLSEFFDSEEVVANYSKKGYQLLIAPTFLEPQPITTPQQKPIPQKTVEPESEAEPERVAEEPSSDFKTSAQLSLNRSGKKAWMAAFTFLIIVAAFMFWKIEPGKPKVEKLHKTLFKERRGYTNETGHERIAEPHPDNKHVIYVRDTFNFENLEQSHGTLVIRAEDGSEWDLESSPGTWYKLAWSPNQTQLLAVEVKRNKGKPLTKNFYEEADYFYAIHVFELDLSQRKLINKRLINHWQGRLHSASWWNDSTIEIVARQGIKASNKRFRIDMANNNALTEINSPGVQRMPLVSSIYRQKVAVAFEEGERLRVVIYDDQTSILTQQTFMAERINVSWIPDGSGVIVYADYKHLHFMYLDGEVREIELPVFKDRVSYRPRFSADGQSLYITEKRFQSNLWNFSLAGKRERLTENDTYNYTPQFSNDGQRVLYASVRNQQVQLWIIENGKERQMLETRAHKIEALKWLEEQQSVLFAADKKLMFYDMAKRELKELPIQAKGLNPLGLDNSGEAVLLVRDQDEQANIWLVSLDGQVEKQLTHGAVGAAIQLDKSVYFQYVNKEGLWVLEGQAGEPRRVADDFQMNAKILYASNEGLYYITGGSCRESDIYVFDFNSLQSQVFQSRDSSLILTHAFHPARGSLGWPCYVAESNIIEYQ